LLHRVTESILQGMNHPRKYYWLPALSLLCCLPGLAETVYKSIDDNGVVSFSDTRPPGDILVETVVVDVPAPPSSKVTEQRLADMRETTDRMASDRMAREKHRAELRQLDAQKYADAASQELVEYYDPVIVYSGDYRRPVGPRRRHHNRPAYPVASPPLLAPMPLEQPTYDYPASLIRKSYDPKVRAALR
jgi:hypothetical protein